MNQADSLLTDDNDVTYDNTFVRDYSKGRVILFNKYAVKATKARVYYAMGKYTEAAKYAREVINATQNFKLNTSTSLDSVMRFPASKEMIFWCLCCRSFNSNPYSFPALYRLRIFR